MAALGNQSIASSYEQLLHVDRDGGGNTSTLVNVKDGDNGTTFCISMTDASTGKAVLAVDGSHASGTEVQIDNSATDGDAFLSFQLSGTSKFTMGVDDGDSDKFKIGTTAIGTGTMFALDSNSRISLSNNDGNSYNTVLGKNALTNNGTVLGDVGADYNTVVGELAMGTANTTSSEGNVAIGYKALEDAVTASYNVAIGQTALANDDNGTRNVAVGNNALYTQNMTGSTASEVRNTAVGDSAGYNNVTGTDCTFIGKSAGLHSLVEGNTFVGKDAGEFCTSGEANTFIGRTSGQGITGTKLTGNYNTCVGAASGLLLQGSGNSNVCVGTSAGDVITSGTDNTCVGKGSDPSSATATNQTCIGHDATGVADNSVTLGNGNVTAVYMAEDSGATVYAAESYLRKDTADTTNQLLTLRNDGGGAGSGTKISMQEGGTVNGRIQTTYDSGWKMKLGSSGGLDELTLFGTNVGIGESNPADAKLQISSVQANDYGIKVTQAQNMNGIYIDNNGTASAEYIENTGSTGAGLEVYTNQGATQSSPLVKFTSDNTAFDQPVLQLNQDGNFYGCKIVATYSTMGYELLHMNATQRSGSTGFNFDLCYTDGDDEMQHKRDGNGATYNRTGTYGTADYAEYFESKDGNEIAIGTTVKLDGEKIVPCADGDKPLGVIRPTGQSLVGNAAWSHWQDKYLIDDYGSPIWEEYTVTQWVEKITADDYVENDDSYKKVEGNKEELYTEDDELPKGKKAGDVKVAAVADTYFREHSYHTDKIPSGITAPDDATVISVEGDGKLKGQKMKRKKLNPDFDPSKTYTSREDRIEWHVVGLLGQIPVTKGQPVSDNWIKMKDVSDTVEMYFVK